MGGLVLAVAVEHDSATRAAQKILGDVAEAAAGSKRVGVFLCHDDGRSAILKVLSAGRDALRQVLE